MRDVRFALLDATPTVTPCVPDTGVVNAVGIRAGPYRYQTSRAREYNGTVVTVVPFCVGLAVHRAVEIAVEVKGRRAFVADCYQAGSAAILFARPTAPLYRPPCRIGPGRIMLRFPFSSAGRFRFITDLAERLRRMGTRDVFWYVAQGGIIFSGPAGLYDFFDELVGENAAAQGGGGGYGEMDGGMS